MLPTQHPERMALIFSFFKIYLHGKRIACKIIINQQIFLHTNMYPLHSWIKPQEHYETMHKNIITKPFVNLLKIFITSLLQI